METPARVAAGEYVIKVKADTSEAEAALAAIKPTAYGIRVAALDRALAIADRIDSPAKIVADAGVFEKYLNGEATSSDK
ncbi:MAG TPA: hypothetical protein VJQ80_01245 [Arthrobacter sp.]|nr:hypothetical protein [Arthrobacter sp.]